MYCLSPSVYKIVLSMGQAESAPVKNLTSRKVLESILAEKGRNRAQGHEMRAPEGMSILASPKDLANPIGTPYPCLSLLCRIRQL